MRAVSSVSDDLEPVLAEAMRDCRHLLSDSSASTVARRAPHSSEGDASDGPHRTFGGVRGMWWDPRNETESSLRDSVDILLRRYQEYLRSLTEQSEQRVYGVGSRPTATGEWRPVVLVDIGVVAGGRAMVDLLRIREAALGEAAAEPLVFEFMGDHDFREESALNELFADWDIPDGTLIELTTPPRPASFAVAAGSVVTPGSVVRGMQPPFILGTAGIVGSWSFDEESKRQSAFVTAGHCVNAGGESIEVVDAKQTTRAGVVAEHWDPILNAPTGSWDVAIVVADVAVQAIPHNGVRPPPMLPAVPFNVAIYTCRGVVTGAASGGALAQVGDLSRQWRDCWSIGPSSLLIQGDSGAVAMDANQRIVGHFVGGSQWPGYPAFLHLYVQDFGSFLGQSGTRFQS